MDQLQENGERELWSTTSLSAKELKKESIQEGQGAFQRERVQARVLVPGEVFA